MGLSRRRRFGHPGLWWLPLLVPPLLGGCSGTPFGEALSRSFPGTGEPQAATSPAAERPVPQAPAASAGGGAATVAPPGGTAPAAAAGASKASAAAPPSGAGSTAPGRPPLATGPAASTPPATAAGQGRPRAASANPSPYRVTIRLPLADPSAPAEVVTEALRAAGVPFEVETIERMGGAASPAASAPAPAAPPAAAPQVRPAPPPR